MKRKILIGMAGGFLLGGLAFAAAILWGPSHSIGATDSQFTISASANAAANTGDQVPIAVAATNNGAPVSDIVDLEIFDQSGTKVFQNAFDPASSTLPSGTTNIIFTWTPTLPGTFTVKVFIFTSGWGSIVAAANDAATITVSGNAIQSSSSTPGIASGTASSSGQFGTVMLATASGTISSSIFSAGTYTLSESSGPAGYAASSWVCNGGTLSGDQITLDLDQNAICTIVNSDMPGILVVREQVINNNGGTAVPGDFTINVTGTNVSDASFPGNPNGTAVTLSAGSYSVGETDMPGYFTMLGGDCAGNIANGETKVCLIVNDDIPPSLTLQKSVVNTNGGTATSTDWTLTATGPTTISGAGSVNSNVPSAFPASSTTSAMTPGIPNTGVQENTATTTAQTPTASSSPNCALILFENNFQPTADCANPTPPLAPSSGVSMPLAVQPSSTAQSNQNPVPGQNCALKLYLNNFNPVPGC